jgi:hypothetical protein
MNNSYDLHSRSNHSRQQLLHEVRMTHLEGRLRENNKALSERSSVSLALANVLSLVRRAWLPD